MSKIVCDRCVLNVKGDYYEVKVTKHTKEGATECHTKHFCDFCFRIMNFFHNKAL